MLTAFVMSMAVAAPVPPPAPPAATGPAPRILELKPDNGGKVMIAVTRKEKMQVGAVGVAVPPGGAAPPAPAVITREVPVTKTVELSEVKDLTVTTADGRKIEPADALKKLEKGGIVVVSSDGKPVSPNFLKLFKDDVLVLSSPELAAPVLGGRPGLIRPLPAPIGPPVVLPANPGGVIQVAPPVPVKPEK